MMAPLQPAYRIMDTCLPLPSKTSSPAILKCVGTLFRAILAGTAMDSLPIEHEIDKSLGLSTQEAVAKLGHAGYNQACRLYCAALHQPVGRNHNPYRALGKF